MPAKQISSRKHLSKKQLELLDRLRSEPWWLSRSMTIDGGVNAHWRGSEDEYKGWLPVHFGTFDSLRNKGLLHCTKREFPSATYELTALGRRLARVRLFEDDA